jgi:hypothetical protein
LAHTAGTGKKDIIMTDTDWFAEADRNYDSTLCMVGLPFRGNGYHSQVQPGTWVHPTRDAIYYALHLLDTGEAKWERRALDIIRRIISLQDTSPTSPTYGIWSWLYEEPLDKMAPPDWNWADFIGAGLAHVIIQFGDRLPADLRADVSAALGHAAWSIFRRNVGPGYTNIAIMGAAVTAMAGELLKEPRLLAYARERIQNFAEYTKEQGGLNEYNSPCYTFVALHEVERILQLVDDPAIRVRAEELRLFIWKSLAERYHPGTKQLAGPHSRAYRDVLSIAANQYLDWALSDRAPSEFTQPELVDFVAPRPCPEAIRPRFAALPAEELVQKDRFIRKTSEADSYYGTTWMNREATLGSINHECFWTQRRPLLGYWPAADGQPAVLRLRLLKDGKDFSSGGLHNAQTGNQVLTGITTYTDRGDYHIHLDRPADGVFTFSNLLLRYELTACDARVESIGNDRYLLSAGAWKAVVTASPGVFNGASVQWRTRQTPGKASLEAVLYEGGEKHLAFDESTFVRLALATELLKENEAASAAPLLVEESAEEVRASWRDLVLRYTPTGTLYEKS